MKNSMTGIIFFSSLIVVTAFAEEVVSINFMTASQKLGEGICSAKVSIRSQSENGKAAAMLTTTTIYLSDSDPAIHFFSDKDCTRSISEVRISKGGSNQFFYFKATTAGAKQITVSTNDYTDDSQVEKISAIVSPPPPPTRTGIRGRDIPSPIYGVTLADISNVTGTVSALRQVVQMPTARIVFDSQNSASYYRTAIQQMHSNAYIMGQILDSTEMSTTSAAAYSQRTQNFVKTIGNQVDIWEIGNEINGSWLGEDTKATGDKVRASFDVVHNAGGKTALTFFWEGYPDEANNCIDGPGFDMFTWINNFLRDPANERVRSGLDYVFISWYPQQCNNIKPDWATIFAELARTFPQAKLGFGEIGTANPQNASRYEVDLINEFYTLAKNIQFPENYVGGYFWWYFYEEMVVKTTGLLNTLNSAISAGL